MKNSPRYGAQGESQDKKAMKCWFFWKCLDTHNGYLI